MSYDAVLLIAFGGPTKPDEIRPFLANVVRGRNVPPERLENVVHHYELIGGRSPLNELTFRQARGLERALHAEGLAMPVYVGMRNWTPYLHETLGQMSDAGVRRVVGVIMAPQQNEAGWDRYIRDIAAARDKIGSRAPLVDFVDEWHAHPLFIEAAADQLARALINIPEDRRGAAHIVFTAHSIPVAMAEKSPYVSQLNAAAQLIVARVGQPRWSLAYQSRSGNPQEPWLEPDIVAANRALASDRVRDVVVAPIGFVCDHVEVLYDLDIEAKQIAESVGMQFTRAATVNDHPTFIRMLADVVQKKVASQ